MQDSCKPGTGNEPRQRRPRTCPSQDDPVLRRGPRLVLAGITLIALPLTTACEAERTAYAPEPESYVAAEPAPARGALRELGAQQPSAPDESAPVEVPRERKLIRNGTLSLEVEEVPAAITRVKDRVAAAEGYVGDESESEDGFGRRSAALTCRVPAGRLDAVIADLRELGRVESVSIGAEDVTAQYFDLEIRLATRRELETRLRELLRRPSNELSDLLEIERELARVRAELDQMEGRKRLWDQQVAMSTLHVRLAEPRPAMAAGEGGVWRTLAESFRRAGENFVLALAGIVSITGGLVPVLLALWLAWLLVRLVRRRRRARTFDPVD